ncbi:organic cation transporter protein-like isoform X2 [Oculina patagonica]
MALTPDQVLEKVGSFGRYQLLLLIFANVLGWCWYGWPALLNTFIAAEPGWRCVQNNNNSECKVNGTVYPGDKSFYHRCNISRDAWEFVDDYTSAVTEFDLVCDKELYGTISSSLVYLGSLIGSIIISSLSDKLGRKTIIFGAGCAVSLFSLLTAFPKVYWLFAVFRFLVGFGFGGSGITIFVLALEFVGIEHRSMMGTSLWYSFPLAAMALAGIAYLSKDWRMLCKVTGAPAIPLLIGYWFTPESLRWLIVKDKPDEASKLCKNIARVNGKEVSEEDLHFASEEVGQRLGDLRDLFGSRSFAKKTLIMWYSWFVNGLMYYGVYFSIPTIGGNLYLNFFLASVIDLPAIPAGIWIYNRFGRKKGVFIPMLLAAAGAAGSAILATYGKENDGYLAGKIILAMIWAKFWIMISYDGIFLYAAELFPTVVRSVAMGTSASASYIGQFTAPYIIFLQRVHPILPYGIMALNASMAGLLCVLLPETRYTPTLETMEKPQEEAYNTKF